MVCFLANHQTQTSVSLFILMSLYCSANGPAVLPRVDSPCPTNSNTQSLLDDDDDPPPVSEALALPSHLIQKPSAIPTIPNIPRVTVRATTSDGKTIYLRKRKKPSPSVSQYYNENSHNTLTFKDVLRLRLHQLKRWEICLQFLFTGLWMDCQLPRQKICNERAYYGTLNP